MRNVSNLRSLSLMLSMTVLSLVGLGCGEPARTEPPGAAPPGSSYDAELAKQKAARADAKAKPEQKAAQPDAKAKPDAPK